MFSPWVRLTFVYATEIKPFTNKELFKMKKNLSSIISIILVSTMLLTGGCTSPSLVKTGTPREAIDPEDVKIYLEEPSAFEEIANLEADSKGKMVRSEQEKVDVAIDRLKRSAAKMGANGIIIVRIATSPSDQLSGGFGGGGGRAAFSGKSVGSLQSDSLISNDHLYVSGVAVYISDQ